MPVEWEDIMKYDGRVPEPPYVCAHCIELEQRLKIIVDAMKPIESSPPRRESFIPFDIEKWNRAVHNWETATRRYHYVKKIAEGRVR